MSNGIQARMPLIKVTPIQIFLDCLLLALNAWDGGIALISQAQARLSTQRRWITENDFGYIVASVVLLPGPHAINTIAVAGYKLAGWRGFFAALSGIVLPGFFVAVALWFTYDQLSQYPTILNAITIGVLPTLAMILFRVGFGQARISTKTRKEQILASICAITLLLIPFWPGPLLILGVSALIPLVFWTAPVKAAPSAPNSIRAGRLTLCLLPLLLTIFQFAPILLPENLIAKIMLIFGSMSLTLFGGGLVMVPMLNGVIVDHLNWLTPAGYSATLAAGQMSPGSVLSIATFTGMQVGGFVGAIAATVGIYLPTALLSVGVSGLSEQLKGSVYFQQAITGIYCAVVGLLIGAATAMMIQLPFRDTPVKMLVLSLLAYLFVCRLKLRPYFSLPLGVVLAWLLALLPQY